MKRAQTSMEYIFILAAVLVIVVISAFMLMPATLKQEESIGGQQQELTDLTASIKAGLGSDGSGGSGTNHAPIITTVGPNSAQDGTQITYSVSWTDDSGDTVTGRICDTGGVAADFTCINPTVICGISETASSPAKCPPQPAPPIGTYTFYGVICDQDDECDSESFTLTVTALPPANSPPEITGYDVLPLNPGVGDTITHEVSWSDPDASDTQVSLSVCLDAPNCAAPACTASLSNAPSCQSTALVGLHTYYAVVCDDEPECSDPPTTFTLNVQEAPFTVYYAPSTATLVLDNIGAPIEEQGNMILTGNEWKNVERKLKLAGNEKRAVQLVIKAHEDITIQFDANVPGALAGQFKLYYEQGILLRTENGIATSCLGFMSLPAGSPNGEGNAGETWFDALIPLSTTERFTMAAGEIRPLWISVTAPDASAAGTIMFNVNAENAGGDVFTETDINLIVENRGFSLPQAPSLKAFFEMRTDMINHFTGSDPAKTKAAFFEGVSTGVDNRITSEFYAASYYQTAPSEWFTKSSFWILPLHRATDWTDAPGESFPTDIGTKVGYFSANPAMELLVYTLDEPYWQSDYEKINQRTNKIEILKSTYSTLRTIVTEQIGPLYKIDATSNWCPPINEPCVSLTADLDYFDPTGVYFYRQGKTWYDAGDPTRYDTAKERPFFYNIGPTADTPLHFATVLLDFKAPKHRAIPWIAWKDQFNGVQYWVANYFYSPYTADDAAWNRPKLFSLKELLKPGPRCVDEGNGWGYLFYPGWSMPEEVLDKLLDQTQKPQKMLPSIRLELWGEGMQDYEYVKCAESGLSDAEISAQIQTITGPLVCAGASCDYLGLDTADANKFDSVLEAFAGYC
ncbi:MAG: class III signal peptide-containing protein [Candidatus Micrarchaeota archaeon]